MTVTQPSQDPNKDSATSAWEEQVTETTNRMQYQIDNITESVDTTIPTVAIYSHTSDGTIQSFEPSPSGDGYVSYYTYSGDYPTLPVGGLTFSAYSDDEINFKIRQYRETANRPTNPGTVAYAVSTGVWVSSTNWTKVKLTRGATNVWYCDADIVGTTGSITAKWGNPRLLYGGQIGSGILYYNTALVDGSAPGKPLVNGYDFDVGLFNGLRNAGQATGGTNNWVYSPITVEVSGANSINKKHWQSAYTVEVSELTEHTTLLNGAITDAASTANITVDSTADFPIPSTGNTPLTIYIGSEQITYTGVTNTTFTGIQRAQNSTSGAEHLDNAVVTTMIPVQVITFGTPAGFVPIGANLQSDNFNGDLTDIFGSPGTAGWGIARSSGNAIFSNVNIRGASQVAAARVTGTLTASQINVDNLAALSANLGTITAGTINGGTLNATDVTVSGAFVAANLNTGVIVQTNAFTAATSGALSAQYHDMFTTSNNDGFDTDIIFYMIVSTNSTSSQYLTGSNQMQVDGSDVTQGNITAEGNGADTLHSANRVNVAKNKLVRFVIGSSLTAGSGSAYMRWSGLVMEVRRTA